MGGQLEDVTRELLSALDALDVDRMVQIATDDAQGVDEISRRWMRGRNDLEGYLRQLTSAVADVHSELLDPEERVWREVGVLTCWLEPSYTSVGRACQLSA